MSKQNQTNTKGNDQRSDSKNPNNAAQKAAQDNRSNQKNPNHQKTKTGK
ncbi:MAG: hypothetical protein V4506_07400 [Bacteroidota bacterium]